MSAWRIGKNVGRTVYEGNRLIGLMDSRELALLVVEAVNALMNKNQGDQPAPSKSLGVNVETWERFRRSENPANALDSLRALAATAPARTEHLNPNTTLNRGRHVAPAKEEPPKCEDCREPLELCCTNSPCVRSVYDYVPPAAPDAVALAEAIKALKCAVLHESGECGCDRISAGELPCRSRGLAFINRALHALRGNK